MGNILGTDENGNQVQKNFFRKKRIRMRKGIELKNKTKIHIDNAFLSPYYYEIEGNIYTGESIFLDKFTIIEDGVNQKEKIKKYTDKNSETTYQSEKSNNDIDSLKYNEYGYSPF